MIIKEDDKQAGINLDALQDVLVKVGSQIPNSKKAMTNIYTDKIFKVIMCTLLPTNIVLILLLFFYFK